MGNNYVQIMTTLGIFIVPMVFVSLLSAFCSTTTSNIVMATVGAAFFLTHRLWLRNIYNRMMKRRYENMDGFRK
jgi:type IV secretory pathway VirB3-like protein